MLLLDDDFLASLEKLASSQSSIRWYIAALPLLSAVRRTEEIASIWEYLKSHNLQNSSSEEKLQVMRAMRESIVISSALIGAPLVS
jgi:hypothetical protein